MVFRSTTLGPVEAGTEREDERSAFDAQRVARDRRATICRVGGCPASS